jgi:hypothetical protein
MQHFCFLFSTVIAHIMTAVIAHIMRQFGRPDSAICAFLDVAVADTGVFGPRLSSSEVCISGTLRN